MSVSANPAANCEMQTQASLQSLWGDLDVLNLDAYNVHLEESDYIDFDGLLAQLVQCGAARDMEKAAHLLQQLAHPDTPPYAVLGSEQWPGLAGVMPMLLTSSCAEVSAAAECLLQQQLAPELLHSSPEPLAQLLTACLSTLSQQAAPAAAQGHKQSEAGATQLAAPAAVASGPQTVSPTVLHFLTSGLQKLGRQWHFLDTALSDQLCTAVAGMLRQPLVDLLHTLPEQPATAAAGTAAAAAQAVAAQQQKEQQSQQAGEHAQPEDGLMLRSEQPCSQALGGPDAPADAHHQLLALQLLQVDPMLSWWQRLNANAASSRPLKAAARHTGIPQLLLQWAEQQQQQQRDLVCCQTECGLPQHGTTCPSSTSCGDSIYHSQVPPDAAGLHRPSPQRLECLAVHCLAALYGTPSGRCLLQEAADQQGPAPRQGQHTTTTPYAQPVVKRCSHDDDHRQQQHQLPQQGASTVCPSTPQQQPCDVTPPGCPAAPAPLLPSSPQPPLSAVLSCLQHWAQLQQPSQQRGQQARQDQPCFPQWGPLRPDALRTAAAPQSPALTSSAPLTAEAGSSTSVTSVGQQQPADGVDVAAAAAVAPVGSSGPSVEVVVQAAAATAAWAVQACEEQQPWFEWRFVQP